MIYFIAFIVFWLVCAVETAGTVFAHFRGKFYMLNDPDDIARRKSFAWCYGLAFGPFGSVMSMFLSRFWQYGWCLPLRLGR